MPTASEFDLAAQHYDRAAAAAAQWATGVRRHFGPLTIEGGLLATVCNQAVDVAENTGTSTAGLLEARAALCRDRAAAVRTYEAAMANYQVANTRWRAAVNDLPDGVAAPQSPHRPAKPFFAD